MPPKANPLRLNALQCRTLVLAQVLARADGGALTDPASGDVTLITLPSVHGDHFHIGRFVVSAKEASGLRNPAVWTALARKGLVRQGFPGPVVLTAEGVAYDTGMGARFAEEDG